MVLNESARMCQKPAVRDQQGLRKVGAVCDVELPAATCVEGNYRLGGQDAWNSQAVSAFKACDQVE